MTGADGRSRAIEDVRARSGNGAFSCCRDFLALQGNRRDALPASSVVFRAPPRIGLNFVDSFKD
jgi:hypothetical protein